MKRQIVFSFGSALILGVFLTMGACNKHNFEDTEFNTGTQVVFKPHGGGEHGDDHGAEGGHGDSKGHDSDKGAHHKGHDGDKHDKDLDHDKHDKGHDKGHDEKNEHKEAHKQPAKSQFPKK